MPYPLPAWALFLLYWLGAVPALRAQPHQSFLGYGTSDTMVVVVYEGEAELTPEVLRARWVNMDSPGALVPVQLSWAGGPDLVQPVEMIELIMAGVDQYLDQRIHFTREGVKTSIPKEAIWRGMERVATGLALDYGGHQVVLSQATRSQLYRVCSIDWSQARFGVDGGDDQEKYMAIYYYVRAQRMELERNLHNDLNPLFGLQLKPAWDMVDHDPAKELTVPTLCTNVMDDDNYLCALDLRADTGQPLPDVRLTETMLAEIARKAEETGPARPEPKLRKRDRWLKAELDAINRRIDQSDQRKELWALRDRMDDMDDRLEDLSLQVDELKRGQEQGTQAASENPVAGLSALTGKNLEVRFAIGSSELGAEARALLLEVVRAMAQAPGDRLLVTGRADASGDAAANLVLSERRAKAVRDFLMLHGIGGERVLLNYYGSARSTSVGVGDRRVDLEWLR